MLITCDFIGCPEQDSNLHASQHSHLKRARLPFRHLGFLLLRCKVNNIFLKKMHFSQFFFVNFVARSLSNLVFIV